jgi:hypothetical protein
MLGTLKPDRFRMVFDGLLRWLGGDSRADRSFRVVRHTDGTGHRSDQR